MPGVGAAHQVVDDAAGGDGDQHQRADTEAARDLRFRTRHYARAATGGANLAK